MRKLNVSRLLKGVVLCLISGQILAQSQQHVWFLKDQRVDFTTVPPTVSPIVPGNGIGNSDPGTINSGSGIHTQTGEKLLTVFNQSINNSSNSISSLNNYEYSLNTPQIIPVPGSTCRYFIVYSTGYPVADGNETVCPNPYSATQDFSYNLYYSEVDMSLNLGQGGVVSNGNILSQCENYSGAAVAVSPVNSSGVRYMYVPQFDRLTGTSGSYLKKYEISATGISSVGNIYFNPANIYNNFKTAEAELSIDGTKLAVANSSGTRVIIFHLNPLTGNIQAGAGTNLDGTSLIIISSVVNHLTGLEFSPNGAFLYVGSRGQGIFSINTSTNSVSSILVNSEQYGNSVLEMGYDPLGDYKIYAVSEDGTKMGIINFPNLPTASFQANYLSNISVFNDGYATRNAYLWGMKQLPHQIDGEDYIARFLGTTEGVCCATTQGFDFINFTASSNATWQPGLNPFGGQTIVKVRDVLRIPTGKTITIQDMEFQFFESAKLVIEPGAKLILKNSHLTSMSCDGLMWKGVELQGNYLLSQSPATQQGQIVMSNNSIISNAKNGISVYGRDINNNIDWSKTGGIITASNSTFRNNTRDVEFLAYDFSNASIFSNCTFVTDQAIKDGTSPYAHITMFHVKNIKVYGSDFKNTTTGVYSPQNMGAGIISFDANYKVSYRCDVIPPFGSPCPDINKDRTKFENLYRGIRAEAVLPYSIETNYTDFINNTEGIYLGGVDYAKVVNNNFTVGSPQSYSYGLYLDHCSGYKVENNQMNTTFPTNTYGIVVVNSNDGGTSPDANEIYNNTMLGFQYGAAAALPNVQMSGSNPITNTGLTFKCNEFDNSTTTDILTVLGGISPFQGACVSTAVGQPHAQANNIFSTPASNIGDVWNANSNFYQMNYRYENGAPLYQTEPRSGKYNLNNTTISQCGVYSNTLSCPERRYDLPNKELKTKIISDETTAFGLISQIDGGVKSQLLTAIYSNMTPGNLKNLVLPFSPYLSDEVLIALVKRSPQLPAGILKEILLANSPLSKSVIDEVNKLNLSNGIMNQLKAAQIGISPLNDIYSQISYWKIESKLAYNELARRYIHDSIVGGEDSLKELLYLNPDNYFNKCKLFGYQITSKEFSSAEGVFTDLRQMDFSKHNDLCTLGEIIISTEKLPSKYFSLINNQQVKTTLENFAAKTDESLVSYKAKILLNELFGNPYQEMIPVYNSTKNTTNEQIEIPSKIIVDNELSFYPNPTKDIITVEAPFKEGLNYEVIVYNLIGEKLADFVINNEQTYFDISSLNDGTYIICINMDSRKINVKIIKE